VVRFHQRRICSDGEARPAHAREARSHQTPRYASSLHQARSTVSLGFLVIEEEETSPLQHTLRLLTKSELEQLHLAVRVRLEQLYEGEAPAEKDDTEEPALEKRFRFSRIDPATGETYRVPMGGR
jgi:hypothetical protein